MAGDIENADQMTAAAAEANPSPQAEDLRPEDAPGKPEVQSLEPGRPMALLGWLRGPGDRMWPLPMPVWLYVVVSIPLTIGLGIWGFLNLHLTPNYNVPESIYHAVKLYTLDLGPAGGGSHSPRPNWQLWLALLLAALLVLRGVVALLSDRLRRTATRYAVRRHVVVCGAGVHGTRLVQALSGKHDVVLVDIDAHGVGMQAPYGKYEWRLRGDCVRDETLLAAGASRAHWVVAMTGNDFVNSQIVSAMRGLPRLRSGVRMLVQVEDPSLARFLEEQEAEGSKARRMLVSPFSANAIAAEALIDTSPVKLSPPEADREGRRLGSLLEMRGGKAPNLLLAGDHLLIDALILAALRRWRVQVLRDLESNSPHKRPPLHLSVFGPGAVERVERLRRRWLPESNVLAIEAKDAEAGGEASAEIEEWLRRHDRADHAIVVCTNELDGVGLTLRISRALGDRVRMTRVTTDFATVLDVHLKERTKANPKLAETDVKPIAELACEPEQMKRLTGPQHLLDALSPERTADDQIGQAYGISREEASKLVNALYRRRQTLGIRSDSTWRILPCERPMLEAVLEPVPLSAFVRAGLRIDLATPTNLRIAAQKLSARACGARARPLDHGERPLLAEQLAKNAFAAWCEYARHVKADSADELWKQAHELTAERLLLLRRRTLGEQRALDGLEPDGTILKGAERVAIFAGPAATLSSEAAVELLRVLKPALRGYDGAILSGGTRVGLPGLVGAVAQQHGLRLIGYTPPGRQDRDLYQSVRETPEMLYESVPQAAVARQSVRSTPGDPRDFSVREPLSMWTDILQAGIPAHRVTVVVFSGGSIATQELLLARALGAKVAWLDPTGAASAPLADTLPCGDEDVLQLPADAMTIRAFITQSRLPEELREFVAQYLHNGYRRKQAGRKPPGDPALAPWDELLDTLKQSNLAQADDIPNKLALIGKQPVKGGARLELTEDDVELLAEAEHGRWNLERLSAGWELGERHVGRGVSPDLKPWDELPEDHKNYDREAVRNIAPGLAEAGWGVGPHRPVSSGRHATPGGFLRAVAGRHRHRSTM